MNVYIYICIYMCVCVCVHAHVFLSFPCRRPRCKLRGPPDVSQDRVYGYITKYTTIRLYIDVNICVSELTSSLAKSVCI